MKRGRYDGRAHPTRTNALIAEHMPTPLADIVEGYIWPELPIGPFHTEPYQTAYSGHWELYMRHSDDAHKNIYGAIDGDNHIIVADALGRYGIIYSMDYAALLERAFSNQDSSADVAHVLIAHRPGVDRGHEFWRACASGDAKRMRAYVRFLEPRARCACGRTNAEHAGSAAP